MRIPAIRGVIERRVLVNFRVDPEALARTLPDGFEPLLVDGHGVAGICLIRLARIRPAALPAACGLSSENAAHRIAVRLADGREGVYIPRRDTDSRLSAALGGRVFPGVHHHASFTCDESEDRVDVRMRSDDGVTRVEVAGRVAANLGGTSVFPDVRAASAFFENGSVGWSDTADAGRYDTLELRTDTWSVTPLNVEHVRSSWFEDPDRFPPGTVEFDDALLMRDIPHAWHAGDALCCDDLVRRS